MSRITVQRTRMRRRLGICRPSLGCRDSLDRAIACWDALTGYDGERGHSGHHRVNVDAARIAYERQDGYVVIVDGCAHWVSTDADACALAMTAKRAARILSLAECSAPRTPAV